MRPRYNGRLQRKRGPKPKPPLTGAQILARADAWHAGTDVRPNRHSGPVPDASMTWLAVHNALNGGTRGLPGGHTLARLLARERGRPDGRGPLGDPAKTAEPQRLRAADWTLQAVGEHSGVAFSEERLFFCTCF
jgi:hypothetical protein